MNETAIIVGGKFHSEALAAVCRDAGRDADVYSTLPSFRFDSETGQKVHTFLWPELVLRIGMRFGFENWADLYKMQAFGKWVAGRLRDPRLLFSWSSFGLESFQKFSRARKVLIRDSAHIQFQNEVLRSEFEFWGYSYPDRSICENRELIEYKLADEICVLSQFAKKTFLDRGIASEKISIVPLGVDTRRFYPDPKLEWSLPIRVAYFGALSLQKGVQYLLQAMEALPRNQYELSLVGSLSSEIKPILKKYPWARWKPACSQSEIASWIRTQHLAVFPSIHDGFASVIPQSLASGVVTLASDHCGASELIAHNETGFVFPARNSEALRELLLQFSSDPGLWYRVRAELLKSQSHWEWAKYRSTLQEFLHKSPV